MHNFPAGNFISAQATSAAYPNALGSCLHRAKHCLFHRSAMSDTVGQLVGHGFGYQKSVQLWLLDFPDVQANFLTNHLFELGSGLVNPLSAASDDDTWPGSVDGNCNLVGLSFEFDGSNAGIGVFIAYCPAYL